LNFQWYDSFKLVEVFGELRACVSVYSPSTNTQTSVTFIAYYRQMFTAMHCLGAI